MTSRLVTLAIAATLGAVHSPAANGASAQPSCALGDGGPVHGCFRPHPARIHATHYYLALGDSLAAGYQPNLGKHNIADQGYADQLAALERPTDSTLELVKLGCGGETTASMIGPFHQRAPSHGRCRYTHDSQLAEAVNFVTAHRGLMSFVTIDIGANDLRAEIGLPTIKANLTQILATLRQAIGPDVPIIGMNYYDPYLAVEWFQTHDIAALQTEAAKEVAFNNSLTDVYTAAGDPVADVASAFAVADTTPVGGIPLDVLRDCQWTWICTPAPLGPDPHPTTTGYTAIAQAFEADLP